MLQPKRVKFRNTQKGKLKGLAYRGNHVAFGSYGLKTMEEGWITSRQIEAARIAVTRYMREKVKFGLEFFQISR